MPISTNGIGHRPIAIELFAGVGGLSLGLESAGFDVPLAVEIEEIAGRYHAFNMPGTIVLRGDEQGDVRNFGKSVVDDFLPEKSSDVTLIAGGPPCQGFSLAGKRATHDPLNDLVVEFARIVMEVSPKAFLVENVPGMTMGDSPYLEKAIRRLSKEYNIIGPSPLWASHFGVPQARQRVFIIGIRKDLKIKPSLPSPTHVEPHKSQQVLSYLKVTPSVWDAIADIPEVDVYPELIDGDRVKYEKVPQSEYARVMRGIVQDSSEYSRRVVWDSNICTNLRRTRHGKNLVERFEGLGFGKSDKTSGIRRLNPHEVSTTIRAGTTKERGSWSAPRPLHPYQNRVITTRECARIQSFPDWFEFHPVKWHGNRQVGNAVPPLLGRAVGTHILKLLGIVPHFDRSPPLSRDRELIEEDLKKALESKLSKRKISQQVVNTSQK